MALSDLTVLSDAIYTTATEILDQQIELFNAATNFGITMSTAPFKGDYSDEVSWKKLSGLVRRRNAYGTGAVSAIDLAMITDTMVKIAAGTPPVNIDPGMFAWLQKSPEEAGTVIGKQLAPDMMADMLNIAIGAGYAAMSAITGKIYDGTGDTPDTLNPLMLSKGSAKMGDAYQKLVCWVVHSTPFHNFHQSNVTNSAGLFTYGTVNVQVDTLGKPIVVTDSSYLITAGTPNVYHNLGLVQGAINVTGNADLIANIETTNGDENILRTYQSEWSYNAGVKGFAWDKTNGGASPNNAALVTATNWDKIATSEKDLAGVIVQCN